MVWIFRDSKTLHKSLVDLVQQMLDAKEKEASSSGNAVEVAQRKCAALDRQIDKLVYELYGLSGEEIKLVESS